MDINSKNGGDLALQSQPQATVKQEKLEPVESTNENSDLIPDSQSYILQQQQLQYETDFQYKELKESNADSMANVSENSDEPIAKRPRRRRQATKPVPPESLDSSDNDNDAGDSMLEMTVTKTEEESESDGDENVDDPEPAKYGSAGDDTEQPGPSGLGKGGTDAPIENTKKQPTRKLRTRSKTTKIECQPAIKKKQKAKIDNSEKWFCKKCNQFFTTRRLLQNHRKVVHLEPHREQMYNYTYNKEANTYSCKVCKKEFAKRPKMREHFLTHEEKFTCEVCDKIQYSAYRYSLHLNEHSGDGKFKCPICKHVTTRKLSILQHINAIHLSKYLYYCKYCGKGFHDVVTYSEHEKLHVGTNTVTCVVCQKEFSYTRNLTLHQTRYHRVTTIDVRLENQCHICKKSYSKASTLKNHMRIHEGTVVKTKRHLCEWCGKYFNDKRTLNHHNRIHTGYKPYKCSYCEKAFSRKGYLVLHERTHSGEKPYCCDHCGKRFNQPTSLRVHVRSHTGERPYNCHLCNNGFISKSTLKNHVVTCSG